MATGTSFTGRTRRRTTGKAVLVADKTARGLITIGGIATIVQISAVFVFLLWVALPLFRPAKVGRAEPLNATVAFGAAVDETVVDGAARAAWPLHFSSDEQQLLGWAVFPDGRLETFRLSDGEALASRLLFPDRALTAMSFPVQQGEIAFGFENGEVCLGTIEVTTDFLGEHDSPPEARELQLGEQAPWRGGILHRTSEAQLRWDRVAVTLQEPMVPDSTSVSPVRLLSHTRTSTGAVLSLLSADGRLQLLTLRERRNLITGQVTTLASALSLPYTRPPEGNPAHLLLGGQGDNLYLAWPDGKLLRYDVRDPARPVVAETLDLVDDGAALTSLAFMNGRTTLVAGDTAGRLGVWFRIKPPGALTSDGALLVRARTLSGPSAPVTALGFSSRGRLLAAGFADGAVEVFHVTSGRRLARARAPEGGPIGLVSLAPKDDGFLALGPEQACRWRLEARHPEASLAALFRPVWYEGYVTPAQVWQSSSATDETELKFGLMPLVFGTLKATVYSLLFGVPLALLAAIFTSEFLKPGLKARVKPTIELMASLPSVVLGFIAALVIAPFAERVVPAILAALVTVPLAFLYGAQLWQLLPARMATRLADWRPLVMAFVLPAGIGAAALLGQPLERLLFAGDIKLWLDGQIGGATGGWVIILAPIAGVATAVSLNRLLGGWRRRFYAAHGRALSATVDAGLALGGTLLALALDLAVAAMLSAVGLDVRGHVWDTYVQRNSLVVGFVMGFAIIPIIYTIAEDALSAVPEHLRAASLGAGATQWQTAMRIVVPTAMSGLFSAVMIGLGRAVGETMIVLMAAGNTPIMEWNVFNGFRTLSANIAVEMPEAVRDSTHYRILFLAALTLFAMTFILNTVAEIVRLRYRKRAFEL